MFSDISNKSKNTFKNILPIHLQDANVINYYSSVVSYNWNKCAMSCW